MSDGDGNLPTVQVGGIGLPLAIYILYLVSFAGGMTAVIGVVMAYVVRQDAPAWQQSHLRFQIRTFWIGLLFSFISALSVLAAGLGVVLAVLSALWLVARCVKGIVWLQKGEEVPDPSSWLLGEART